MAFGVMIWFVAEEKPLVEGYFWGILFVFAVVCLLVAVRQAEQGR